MKKIALTLTGLAVVAGIGWGLNTIGVNLDRLDKAVSYKKVHAEDKPLEILKIESKDTLAEKIEQLKQDYLDTLSLDCETKNLEDPDGAIIFDSNDEASVGRFQFQRKTVIGYYKMLYNEEITKAESIAIAIDPVRAKQLAYDIIFTEHEDKKEGNWYNCSQRPDLKKMLEVIKTLEE